MHITKIELEDIKSHQAATFEFERGTTAITGANGAGKTTIIEAVAWTLFDLLDYKKEDFVRRGAKKGVVNVTFESSLDERQYRVYRDTGNGYYVYDPQLKTRIADKKEEVARFLWAHLGVEAGTDLESLFRRAIGVPQGTFTAIFLETAAERKKAFDKLLKVEEYRQGAEKLRETVRYIENKITAVREKIARAEGELARFELVETEYKTFANQAKELGANLEKLENEVDEKSQTVEKFDEVETKVNELKSAFDKLHTETIRGEILLQQKENELNQANAAAERIKVIEVDYKKHLAALAELKSLDAQRAERDRLRVDLAKIENAIVSEKAEQKSCGENLKKVSEARENISKIQPQVRQQTELEKHRETLRNDLASAKAAENQVNGYEEKLKNLRNELTDVNNQIRVAEEKSADVENFEKLQKRDAEIIGELAKIRAVLERDEQFERKVTDNLIKNHFCPIVSQKCLNLETGKASESNIGKQNGDGKTQIVSLETEQKTITVKLGQAREAEKFSAILPTLFQQKSKTTEDGKKIREEQESWRIKAENLGKIKTELAEIEVKLNALGNPQAKLLAFESEVRRENELKEKLFANEKKLLQLESEKSNFSEQMLKFEALDAEWKRLSAERDQTADAHRKFLANESLALTLPTRQTEFETAKAELANFKTESEKAEDNFQTASKNYDREMHLREKSLLLDAEKWQTETRANLEHTKKREMQLAEELKHLAEIRKAMQGEFQEKERLEKIGEATTFIRDTLKEAAPRVARNYVFHVSMEANQMFREISGNAERTLKWTEDYGIILEEDGFERPFVNLSGGEQMAAALSVRLALLKQLSDVRLAFFDEPTTNMDAERRERLAEQISHITERKTFDQLFVISHDDTFEAYVDNVISVNSNEVNNEKLS
ncbi:MAG: SMC family ATPase [Acidobacteria bacterium]|jgi:exonuclease SbcC|nr:SMC family ATPase [Acidobacteriota bacterium]